MQASASRGQPGRHRRPVHHARRLQDAAAAPTGAGSSRTALRRLDRDERLEDGGRGRVGGGDDRGHHAHRLGDLDHAPRPVLAQDRPPCAAGGCRRGRPRRQNRFLMVLSLTLPKPVSSWARRARRSASPRAAAAIASTMRSTCSWEKSASDLLRLAGARRRGCAPAGSERRSVSSEGLAIVGGPRAIRPSWRCRRRAPPGQDLLDFLVRPRDHVHGDELADAPRRGRARVGGRLHRAHVAAHHARSRSRRRCTPGRPGRRWRP